MRIWSVLLSFLILGAGSSFAQEQDKSIIWYDYPEAELRALDKITAEATTFKVKVGQPAKFGKIYMKVQACRKPAPIDKLESAAFVQVWEKSSKKEEDSKWVFSGWMFASSPSLSAMDHPIYDVWLLNCIGEKPKSEEEVTQEPEKPAFDSMLESLTP